MSNILNGIYFLYDSICLTPKLSFCILCIIVNGVMEMIQVVLQLSFITSLKHKEYFVNSQEQQHPDGIMPGRQITVFLFLFNLAQWIVFTFEIQKVRASQVEEGK